MAKDVMHLATGAPRPTRSRSRVVSPAVGRAYDADVHGWALDQARLLRARRLGSIDIANVADEIEDVARREFQALESNLAIILEHMLKWDHQPERRSRSWASSIREHRRRVSRAFKDSPSLSTRREEALLRAYQDACDRASSDTNLPLSTFAETNPYTWTEIVERPFVYDPE